MKPTKENSVRYSPKQLSAPFKPLFTPRRTWLALLLAACGLLAPGRSLAQSNLSPAVSAQINAIQAEKTARTPAENKLESKLLYLSREVAGQPAVAGAPDLKSRVSLEADGRVLVDISAVPSADLSAAITNAGGTVIYESPRWKSVRATLPPAALASIAARADVKHIAKGEKPRTHAGSVTSEGDATHLAGLSRTNYGVDGTGIKVGVISDSCDGYTNSIATGDLPASFKFLAGRSGIPASGEGTAMSEIVHDLAPGAQIVFANAGPGPSGFADSIIDLRTNGCQIIVDDISYGSENPFQDDVIGLAVDQVVTNGALYLSSSGNEGNLEHGTSSTWEGDFLDGGAASAPLPTYGHVHSFGTQNYNVMPTNSIDSGMALFWSDEGSTSSNDYDLFILNSNGTSVVASSVNTQNGSQQPYENVDVVHPGERIVIFQNNGAAARFLHLWASKDGALLKFATTGETLGHAGTANCIGVAASDATLAFPSAFTTSSPVEDSSSDGPRKQFYKSDGSQVTPGNLLASGGTNIPNPSLTAADGVTTSLSHFNPFYGTSAAAPHAAAIAALVWSKQPTLSNAQVRAILQSSCLDIDLPGFDVVTGNGILMANLALSNAPPANVAPTIACPGNISTTNNIGQSYATVAFTNSVTGVPPPVVICTLGGSNIASPFPFPVGTNLVTCTATNVAGTNSCSFTVTVIQTTNHISGGTWTPLANQAPVSIESMMLMSDGTVVGLQANAQQSWYRLTPDTNGSYLNGTWSALPKMHYFRESFSQKILRDGRLFVAGGEDGNGGQSAEFYEPTNNTWTETPSPGAVTADPAGFNFIDGPSEILPNGDVLEAPIQPALSDITVIYHIASNTWSAGPVSLAFQDESSWVKLPDDSILTIDFPLTGDNSTERFIPALNQWIPDAPVSQNLWHLFTGEIGGAYLLPNGKVFCLGGTNRTAIYTPSGTTNVGSWVNGPDIPDVRGLIDAPSAMMVNGKILLGASPATNGGLGGDTYYYEYDYASNAFTRVSSPTGGLVNDFPSYHQIMLDLPDGTVLMSVFSSQLYVYTPDGTPLTNGQPTITSVTTNGDGSLHVTGTLFDGISEGANYGDENQNSTCYPIGRITDGFGNVRYCRTYNWSSTSRHDRHQYHDHRNDAAAGTPAGDLSLGHLGQRQPFRAVFHFHCRHAPAAGERAGIYHDCRQPNGP